MNTHRLFLLVAFCTLVAARVACGYQVGPAPTLEKVAADADLIFKGEVIGTEPVQDEWFKPIEGFAAYETRFKVISIIKGEPVGRRCASGITMKRRKMHGSLSSTRRSFIISSQDEFTSSAHMARLASTGS